LITVAKLEPSGGVSGSTVVILPFYTILERNPAFGWVARHLAPLK
jgi:hypothetical protein